ncbi:MAG: hypothetical protein QM817_35225 [Archangium sp.]
MLFVLVVVLGATEVHGAASTGVQATEGVRIVPFVHGQLGVAREFGEVTLSGRASVLLQFDAFGSALSGEDLGSSLDVSARVRRGWTLNFRLLPLNANVLLPTTDWANRWGRTTQPFSPALSVSLDGPQFRAWLALRPGISFTRPIRWSQSVLAGVASTTSSGLRFDVRGAVLDYGKLLIDPLQSAVLSNFALVGDALAGYVWNEDVGPALDFATYRTDPTRFERFLAREPRRHANAARVTLEGGFGTQWFAGVPQSAGFVDLQGRVRLGPVRVFATGRIRTATQVNFDTALKLIDQGQSLPELTALAGADVQILETGLRPGVLVRVMRTASPSPAEPPTELTTIVPPSPGATGLSVKFSLTWLAGNIGGVAGELELGSGGVRWLLLGQVRF